ncbi:MAG: phosphoglycerate kinase [Bacteroidota bacterium]|nr:phosphoglycerate kinase [Bacteroidota bacterium]
MRTLKHINFESQRAIVRVDFNVPLDKDLQITDITRIKAAKPTIDYILSKGGSCVLLSHLGRPNGFEQSLSFQNIIDKVSEILETKVQFCKTSIGPIAQSKADSLMPGEVLLMENLRFNAEETEGDVVFSERLSKLGTIFVNDAFGTAHRPHASTTIIANFFQNNKCFGSLLEKEVLAIDKVIKDGTPPILAILGGAKVSTKITIIESLLEKVNHLIIGGGMVYTFTKALGGKVGNSICELDYCDYALDLIDKAKQKNVKLHFPIDVVAGNSFSNEAKQKIFDVMEIGTGWEALDAGPESIKKFHDVIIKCKTILWNGPLGVFEFPNFSAGTIAAGKSIAEATINGSFSLVGGGDSVAAVKKFKMDNDMSYISTGGGAMLESLEGKTLPGIAALNR